MSEVRRSWADKEHTRIRCYQFVEGRHTIPSIIEDLKSRGADWALAELNYSATWEDDPTAEEVEKHRQAVARSIERQESWERETYIRLTEKYGDPRLALFCPDPAGIGPHLLKTPTYWRDCQACLEAEKSNT